MNPWSKTFILGVALLALSGGVIPLFPTETAIDRPAYGPPILAFEFARTTDDLVAVFGVENDPERTQRIEKMDRGNRWDYALMLTYGAFLFAFGSAMVSERKSRTGHWVGAFGIAAAIADSYENSILLRLTPSLTDTELLAILAYPVSVKFILLALAGLCIGAFIVGQPGRRWTLAGAVTMAGAIAACIGVAMPAQAGGLAGAGIGIGWLIAFVYAIARYRDQAASRTGNFE